MACRKYVFKIYLYIFFLITVSLSFFDDIYIPADCLPENSKFVEEENVWVWVYQDDTGVHQMFMDIGSSLLFML